MPAQLIAIDWGSTNCRASLIDAAGAVLAIPHIENRSTQQRQLADYRRDVAENLVARFFMA